MTFSRRAFLASSALVPAMGCNPFVEQSAEITYVNGFGRWLSGTIYIGDLIADGHGGAPLMGYTVSARPSLLSGQPCRYSAIDEFTHERFELEGEIPVVHRRLESPMVTIVTSPDGISATWTESSVIPSEQFLVDLFRSRGEPVKVVWFGPRGMGWARATFRQRPEPFGTGWGDMAERLKPGEREHVGASWILSPEVAWESVLVFSTGMNLFGSMTWRTNLDLRDIPRASQKDNALWLETNHDGTYRVGWFRAPELSSRELQKAGARGELVAPSEYWTGKAKEHPILELEDPRTHTIAAAHDIRFDDEM